jgi:hypothetical protein
MKKINISILAVLIIGISIFNSACHKHDDHKHDEGENINAVTLEFYRAADSLPVFTSTWSDEDGIGGKDPILPDTLILEKDSLYTVHAKFNHIKGIAKHDVTAEIKSKANEHLICFTPKTIIQAIVLEITRTDRDSKNLEIGLTSEWKGIIAEQGSVQLSLKHQVKTKNGSCAIGETDIEVDFPFVIK